MDYLCVGSTGFAQLGTPDCYPKMTIEMSVLMHHMEQKFPVPDNLQYLARYKVMKFDHDFGTYREIVVSFDDNELHRLSDSEDTTKNELVEKFWDWFNTVESEDLDTDHLRETMTQKYMESLRPEGNLVASLQLFPN